MFVLELFGNRDFGDGLAFVLGDHLAIGPHHVAHREQPAVRGHELEEFRRQPADAGAVEHGGQRLQLLVGGKHRAAHQTVEIGAFGDERIEALEIGLHRVDRVGLAGEIEQAGRVAASHAGDDGFCCGQSFALFLRALGSFEFLPKARQRSLADPRKPLGFKRDLDVRWTSRKSPRRLRKSPRC